MQKIPITQAAPGMVLAQEIKNSDDPSSMTICGKGVKLTESLISRLMQMGVQSVRVEGHPVKIVGEATLEEMLAELDQRFSRVEDDVLMKKVKEMFRKQIFRALGESDGG
jgi:hypothetical protein